MGWYIQSGERKNKNFQVRILNLAKLSFKSEGELKTFSAKQTWRSLLPLNLPYKIDEESSTISNERMLNNNMKAYKSIKFIGKDKYIAK